MTQFEHVDADRLRPDDVIIAGRELATVARVESRFVVVFADGTELVCRPKTRFVRMLIDRTIRTRPAPRRRTLP